MPQGAVYYANMKKSLLHAHSPVRIFAFSGIATIAVLVGVAISKGLAGVLAALVLIAVEVSFSFDNAILNAKVLAKMSRLWQTLFLTVGALVAVFGMRIVFPIVIVAITADIGWREVLDLALHHPHEYAEKLHLAHPVLSAFGGAFLLVLALGFFASDDQEVEWFTQPERLFRKFSQAWVPAAIALAVVGIVSVIPANHHGKQTAIAGVLGVVVYSLIHGLTHLLGRLEERNMKHMRTAAGRTGWAACISFVYLEILDATFSFDGVLGAFAITSDVILIAVGLGVGALWVRSLTVYMVRRGTLGNYKYIEHGAHYTIGILACILFLSLFIAVPEAVTGLAGIGVIVASIIASRQAIDARHHTHTAK